MRDKVVELLDIGGIMNTFARELSLGQRMRADLAMMLLHNP
jgi:ABC-2 type transport system ATP-binding protein